MSLLVVLCCLLLLVAMIAWLRIHAFLALTVVALLAGWWLGLPLQNVVQSVKTGMGNILGDLVIVVCCGAMLGKLIAETGAAARLTEGLISFFGIKRLPLAMMVTGFLVGIPLFYNVGFVLLVPLVFSIVYRTRMAPVYVALPMLAALSVTHGFLPPHPSPLAIAAPLGADVGKVLVWGLVVAVPTVLLAGYAFASTLRDMHTAVPDLFRPTERVDAPMPGLWQSLLCALMPVLLLILGALLQWKLPGKPLLSLLFDPVLVMLFSLGVASVWLGIGVGMRLADITKHYSEAIKDISVILLIIAGAGALKQVLVDSGVGADIGTWFSQLNLPPLLLGWMVAAIIRICIGSATVAGLTAVGIIAPMQAQFSFDPNLMVLSIGAGSLVLSHINDSGFWMFKEYFNLSVKQTFRTWTVMETGVSIVGLAGVLLLNAILH